MLRIDVIIQRRSRDLPTIGEEEGFSAGELRQSKRRRVPHEVKVEHEDRQTPASGHYTRGKHVRVYYDESMSDNMEDTSREATPPRCEAVA